MSQIAKAVDEEVVNRDLVPAFVKLLKDTEAEVRSAIAGQIPGKAAKDHKCGAMLTID
jgi:serine/threonine-protein phosphatase 2A regulatory subunit A